MNRLRIAAIVEGDGEVASVPILLRRLGTEILGGRILEIPNPPIRRSRGELLKAETLQKAVALAWKRLTDSPACDEPSLILVLIDSERECPRMLGPRLLEAASGALDPRADVSCVLAHVMYETWFAASAASLGKYLEVDPDDCPHDPEQSQCGKSWIKKYIKAPKYKETTHQAKMTAVMDLKRCRAVSPSFDKLCRELEKRFSEDGRTGGS